MFRVLHVTRAQSSCSQYTNGSHIIPSLTMTSVKAVFRTVFHVQNLLRTTAGQTHSLCSRSGQFALSMEINRKRVEFLTALNEKKTIRVYAMIIMIT